jgi:saccharopine dehydrogenase-like NADP-dependent oxidoreductase
LSKSALNLTIFCIKIGKKEIESMKKILVLGGVGAMATETSIDLVKTSDFEQIMIADINLAKIEAFIEQSGDSRLKAAKINAESVDEMAELISGYDVVANGLPRVYCENAIRAGIKAKVDMLDLISPHEETLALDDEAQSAGISIVGGVGITPGITNILAQLGADRLETVERIDIDFAAFRSIAHSPGLLHVILWEFDPRTENRFYFDGGRLIPNPPFSGARSVDFPEPIGTQTTYYVPHGESQTLSKNIPGVNQVFIRGCFPPRAMGLVKMLYDYGIYDAQPIDYQGSKIQPLEFLNHYLLNSPAGDQTDVWGYSVQVEVQGVLNGYEVMVRFVTDHPPMAKWGGQRAYAKNVGIPLSIGAQLLAQGKARKKGVDGVETMLPAEDFVNELRKRGFVINESLIYR